MTKAEIRMTKDEQKQDHEKPPRPKVGDILGAPIEIPESAFAPLTDEELEEWLKPIQKEPAGGVIS